MPSVTLDLPDEFTDVQAIEIAELLSEVVGKLKRLGLTNERVGLLMFILAGNLKAVPFEEDPVKMIRAAALNAASAGLFEAEDEVPDVGGDGDENDDEDFESAEIAIMDAISGSDQMRALERFLKRLESKHPEERDLASLRKIVPEGLQLLHELVSAVRGVARAKGIRIEEDVDAFRSAASDEEIDAEERILFINDLSILQAYLLSEAAERLLLLSATLRERQPLGELAAAMKDLDLPARLNLSDDIEAAKTNIDKYEETRALLFTTPSNGPLTPNLYLQQAPVDRDLAEAWLDLAIAAGEIEKLKKGGKWILLVR
jgi:hypothetical protein